MEGNKTDRPSKEDLRSNAEAILEDWQSVPSFAELLDKLLHALRMSSGELSRRLANCSNAGFSTAKLMAYRTGRIAPTYELGRGPPRQQCALVIVGTPCRAHSLRAMRRRTVRPLCRCRFT